MIREANLWSMVVFFFLTLLVSLFCRPVFLRIKKSISRKRHWPFLSEVIWVFSKFRVKPKLFGLFNIASGSLDTLIFSLNPQLPNTFPLFLLEATPERLVTFLKKNEFTCIWLRYITEKQTQRCTKNLFSKNISLLKENLYFIIILNGIWTRITTVKE